MPDVTPRAPGGSAARASDPWNGLRTLIRTRLVVAVLGLPVGVLLAPGATRGAWVVLVVALAAVGLLSLLFSIGVRLHRGLGAQTALQLACDLAIVASLAAVTGGRGSQFSLFFGLVVVAGGLLGRIPGGGLSAAGASAAFIALPWISRVLAPARPAATLEPSTPVIAVVAYLGVLGVLAGTLGERVQRTRTDLERTARELDRVRVDNDTVLRHLTTGVLSTDREGVVAYVNPAAEQMLGVRALELRGRSMDDAMPARLRPLCDVMRDTLRSGQPRARAEIGVTGATNRGLPLGLSTNLLMHEGQVTGVVAVFQDLTEVREMERRARRNETLAEIGALSARIAHELRNGLNPISGSVECLQRELRLDGENAVLMELINRECVRLNRFVSDLLNYSRERDLALEPLDVAEHLAELCDGLRRDPRRPANVRVDYEPGPAASAVRGDRDQLRQVWLNLSANAFEAMPRGGRLTVRLRPAEDGTVGVEFEDTGSGITAEDLPRVGQPFYTTKQGGTGLGLAIASRIVERHGGALSFESAVGRGTVVRVALPVDETVLARAA